MLTLRRSWYFGILFLFSLTASALAADKPISFEADQVTVNKETGSMLATGNVFLRQNGTELLADEVTYDQGLDKAVARGNVFMTSEEALNARRFYDAGYSIHAYCCGKSSHAFQRRFILGCR